MQAVARTSGRQHNNAQPKNDNNRTNKSPLCPTINSALFSTASCVVISGLSYAIHTVNAYFNPIVTAYASATTYIIIPIITNPNAISQIENNKKDELNKSFQQLLEQTAESEEAYNAGLEKLNDYYTYEWQDIREIRGNSLLTQYKKELS